jgi:hypothetical protein
MIDGFRFRPRSLSYGGQAALSVRAGCATLRDANLACFKIQLLASRHALLW